MAARTKKSSFKLDPEWIYKEPLDFEYKKYTLLAYLQKCDKNFDDLKIYPDFVELSLHLANLQSINKENTMLLTKKKFSAPDDEILFKELFPKKPPVLDEEQQEQVNKTIKYSGQIIYEAFSVEKSIWTIAQDAISVHVKRNKDRLEDGRGYVYFRRKEDDKLFVWEYEIKKEEPEDYLNKTHLNLIYSANTDEKTFSQILDDHSTWNLTDFYREIPIFEARTTQEFPYEETFIPMMKRALMAYIFQVVNFKKLRDLED